MKELARNDEPSLHWLVPWHCRHWGGGLPMRSPSGPIRIGMIYSKQGPGASIGQYLQRGSELAVEQAGRKVLGRPIELVWLDEPRSASVSAKHAAPG